MKIRPFFSTQIFFLAAFLLASCGKFDRIEDGGFTTVNFQRDRGPTAVTLTGGILIYMYSTNYVTNMKISDETQEASITLPNGNYSFYAFGYSTSFNSSTDLQCAIVGDSSPVALTGAGQTVNLAFNHSNCTNGAFTTSSSYVDPTGGTNQEFPRLQLAHCGSNWGTSLANTNMQGYFDCASTNAVMPSTTYPWTAANAMQIIVPLFKSSGGGSYSQIGEAYRSSCNTASTSGSALTLSQRFPIGNVSKPGLFPLQFETFSETSCTSSPLAQHTFHKGLVFGPLQGNGRATGLSNTGATNFTRIFLREP